MWISDSSTHRRDLGENSFEGLDFFILRFIALQNAFNVLAENALVRVERIQFHRKPFVEVVDSAGGHFSLSTVVRSILLRLDFDWLNTAKTPLNIKSKTK